MWAAEATPGPWTIEPAAGTDAAGKPATWKTVGRPVHAVDDDVDDDRTHVSDLDDCVGEADADFIAAARSDVPALLAEIRELRRERDSAHAAGMEQARQIIGRMADAWMPLNPKSARTALVEAAEAIESARTAEPAGGKQALEMAWDGALLHDREDGE